MKTSTTKPNYITSPYLNALCLVDTQQHFPPPDFLVSNRSLFIIQAASPNPDHTEWQKPRTGILKFVLNPPDAVKMTQASVLFSLILSIMTLTGPDYIRLLLHHFEDNDQIKDWIKAAIKDYSCNMHNLTMVLQGNRMGVDNRIYAKIDSLNFPAVWKMLVDDMTGNANASRSHTLVMSLSTKPPTPDTEQYFQSNLVCHTLTGAVIYKALLCCHGLMHYNEIKLITSLVGRVGPAASAGGWLWEGEQ
jgi:hypothetical protein